VSSLWALRRRSLSCGASAPVGVVQGERGALWREPAIGRMPCGSDLEHVSEVPHENLGLRQHLAASVASYLAAAVSG